MSLDKQNGRPSAKEIQADFENAVYEIIADSEHDYGKEYYGYIKRRAFFENFNEPWTVNTEEVEKAIEREKTARPMIGPFFYVNGEFITHRIPVGEGIVMGGKVFNPCFLKWNNLAEHYYNSARNLYSFKKVCGENYNRSRYKIHGYVVWDICQGEARIRSNAALFRGDDEKRRKLYGLFGLKAAIEENLEDYKAKDADTELEAEAEFSIEFIDEDDSI